MPHRDCRCGHVWDVHQHYRPGSDCSQCRCIMYQPRRWWARAGAA